MFSSVLLALVCVFVAAVFIGRNRAVGVCTGHSSSLHSRPMFHGGYMAIWAAVPALVLLLVWAAFSGPLMDRYVGMVHADAVADLSQPQVEAFIRDARALAFGGIVGFKNELKEAAAATYRSAAWVANAVLIVGAVLLIGFGLFHSYRQISVAKRTRHFVEKTVMAILILCSAVAILTTIGIVLSLIFESLRFFQKIPLFDFLFGLHWSPSTLVRPGEGDSAGDFGAIPLFAGTLLITAIAILIAAPIGSWRRSSCPTTRPRASAPSPSRCSRSSPASPPWSTASSPP